jgi:nitroreductase
MQNEIHGDVKLVRQATYEINPIFLNRWSPRAFSEKTVDDDALHRVFEAARWAPSSANEQPWRFIIARSEEDRERFVSFLFEGNQIWARHAPVLIAVVSRRRFASNEKPNLTYQFDAGCAWGFLALAATENGLIAHGMAGFDREQAREVLALPEEFDVIAMVALGYRGDKEKLPEALQAREMPSARRPQTESVMEGRFRA